MQSPQPPPTQSPVNLGEGTAEGATHPTPVSRVTKSMLRGLLLRCPQCGQGRLFAGPIAMQGACSECGHTYEFHPGNWSGAVMISQMLMGLIAIPVFLLLSLLTPMDFTMRVFWTVVIVLALWLITYRNIKGLWYGWLLANQQTGAADQSKQ
jgi:uncharacterized protein (DUF983 family)